MPSMTTITFDTLEGAAKLRAAGFDEMQVRVLADAQEGLVTRSHFDTQLALLRADMAVLRTESGHTRWMLGVVIALAAANFAKQFF